MLAGREGGSPLQAIGDMREKPQSGECQGDSTDIGGGLLFARPVLHGEVGEAPHRNPPDDDEKGKKEFHSGVEGGNLLGQRGRFAYASATESRHRGMYNRTLVNVDPLVAVGISEEGRERFGAGAVPARHVPERLRGRGKEGRCGVQNRTQEILHELECRVRCVSCGTNQENT